MGNHVQLSHQCDHNHLPSEMLLAIEGLPFLEDGCLLDMYGRTSPFHSTHVLPSSTCQKGAREPGGRAVPRQSLDIIASASGGGATTLRRGR